MSFQNDLPNLPLFYPHKSYRQKYCFQLYLEFHKGLDLTELLCDHQHQVLSQT